MHEVQERKYSTYPRHVFFYKKSPNLSTYVQTLFNINNKESFLHLLTMLLEYNIFLFSSYIVVDNGVKYDASRAFLSDLNITESVWIGLMRSQNSDRFMWS